MAEGYKDMPKRENITITSTNQYVNLISAFVSGDILYLQVEISKDLPSTGFQDIQLTLPNNGRTLKVRVGGTYTIGASADIGKTVSASIGNSATITMRISEGFVMPITLWFQCPYY